MVRRPTSSRPAWKPRPVRFCKCRAPRFEVIMMMVFRKSTVLPSPSVNCPSSNTRSEEHTSQLQSRLHLVCRLLLEKKKQTVHYNLPSTTIQLLSTALALLLHHTVRTHF